MIAIATSIILGLTLLISAFLGFSPQIHKLVEKDMMRRAYNNTLLYGLQLGQIGIRAKTLTTKPSSSKEIDLPFRAVYSGSNPVVQDSFNGTVELIQDKSGNLNIDVDIKHEFQ